MSVVVKRMMFFCAVALFVFSMVMPVWASTAITPKEEQKSASYEEIFQDPKSLFKLARNRLLKAQSEIIKQANDAKSRVEIILAEYTKLNANEQIPDAELDNLRRDLYKVKESQKAVTVIINEVKAVMDQELDPEVNLNSPEYLNKLTAVYNEKAALLEKEAEILGRIAKPIEETQTTTNAV